MASLLVLTGARKGQSLAKLYRWLDTYQRRER